MERCVWRPLTCLLLLTGIDGLVRDAARDTDRLSILPYIPVDKSCHVPEKEYYNRSLALCCSKCPPGTLTEAPCTRDGDTKCRKCPDGTHTEVWNNIGQCLSCRGRCRAELGLMELQNCTALSRRICACKSGTFCKSGLEESDTTCTECAPHRLCPPGHGVKLPGNHSDDTLCEVCDEGTFSNESSATSRCQTHKDCSRWSRNVSKPGNSTADTVCGPHEEEAEKRMGRRNADSTSVSLAVLSAILFLIVVAITACLLLGSCTEQAIPLSCFKKVFRTCISDLEAQEGDEHSSEGVRTDHLLCPTASLQRETPPRCPDPPAESHIPGETLPKAHETLAQSCDALNQSGTQASPETNRGPATAKENGESAAGIVGPVYIYNASRVYVGVISSERRVSEKGLLAREAGTVTEDELHYPQQELGETRGVLPEQERGKECHLSEKVSEGS